MLVSTSCEPLCIGTVFFFTMAACDKLGSMGQVKWPVVDYDRDGFVFFWDLFVFGFFYGRKGGHSVGGV